MLCPECNKEELKFFNGKWTKRCRFCTRKLTNEKANEKRLKEIEERKKLMIEEKECLGCGKNFLTDVYNQRHCYEPCTPRGNSIQEKNAIWDKPKRHIRRKGFKF